MISLSRRLLSEPEDDIRLPEKFKKEFDEIVPSYTSEYTDVFRIISRTLGKFQPHIYSKENALDFLNDWEKYELKMAVINFLKKKQIIIKVTNAPSVEDIERKIKLKEANLKFLFWSGFLAIEVLMLLLLRNYLGIELVYAILSSKS